MKHLKPAVAGLLLMVIASASSIVLADPGGRGHGYRGGHHGGGHVGIYLGGPLIGFGLPFYGGYGGYAGYPGYGYGGYGPYAPYGYGPSTTIITAPEPPPVYIEQNSSVPNGPASDGNWYYCHNPDGYYPYVRQCAENWQQVPSQPVGR